MKNRAKGLHEILSEQLERLNDKNHKGDELNQEISRADAMGRVAIQIINNGKLVLEAVRVSENTGLTLPEFLDTETIPKNQNLLAPPEDNRGQRSLLRARRSNE